MHVAIVGAGIAGLGAALALGRAGHRVTLLERDATPLPETPGLAFERWERRGAPQVKHSHAFLARLRNLLRDRAPDVLAALLAAGAEELPLSNLLRPGIDDPAPKPGDDDLTLLACRRITFEWVLHRLVERERNVTFRDGCEVRGLVVAGELAGKPRVAGLRVRVRSGEEVLAADLVVDASGRRSPLARWLDAAGLPKLRETSEPCGVYYCSRFYELRDGITPPERETTIGADLGYLKYAIFHGDSRIFSITFAAAPEDKPLRALLREAPFEAAARQFPVIARWIDPAIAQPITTVFGMDGLRNTRRTLCKDAEPRVAGVVLLGDAAIHTNPLYGRGCTFALLHAWMLADALSEGGGDVLAVARALEAATEREIVPWYAAALAQDRDAAAWAAKLREEPRPGGEKPGAVDPRAYFRDLMQRGLVPALRLDATVLRAFSRGFNLLDAPGDLMKRPDLLQRVLKVYQAREQREEPYLGPGRAELIAALATP
ncbi:MAG: FAD-dependent oxidoreductase [Deltaproteobacteria bacterium]|nr:FAD-dependent oxidoreductase [Deltaproteobacteria bacterium]